MLHHPLQGSFRQASGQRAAVVEGHGWHPTRLTAGWEPKICLHQQALAVACMGSVLLCFGLLEPHTFALPHMLLIGGGTIAQAVPAADSLVCCLTSHLPGAGVGLTSSNQSSVARSYIQLHYASVVYRMRRLSGPKLAWWGLLYGVLASST